MDSFLDWVGLRAEKMLDLLIDLFGIVFGSIIYGLLWMTGFSSIGFTLWIIVGSLVLGARKLFRGASRSLKAQWRALSESDPDKPRIPEVRSRRPSYAVCDPITDSSDPSKDGKKKSSFEVAQMKKVKKFATRLRRKTSRLEYKHRQEHKTNPRPTRNNQQTEEQSSEVEKLKSRIIELGAYLRAVEESRAELLQRQTTWTYPYDKDLEIPGRLPTISARLPVPEFRISDVIDRRKAKAAAPFNITFYSMPNTIVRPKASTLAVRSLPSADKTIDQPVKHPVTSLAVVPSSVHSPVQSSAQSSAQPSIQSRIKSRARKLVRLQTKMRKNAPVSSSPYAPTSRRYLSFAPTQPIAIPSPNSQISAPDSPAVSENNREVSQKGDKLAEESEKDASDYSINSERDSEENRSCPLPSLQESDEGDGKSGDGNLTLLPGSDDNNIDRRNDVFPPLPDSDAGSDGEASDEDQSNRPNNAGSVARPVIQQLAETLSHTEPAKEPPSTSLPVPAVIKPTVQGPSITPLGNWMEVDIQNENGPEEGRAKTDAMDVDAQNEASGKECATAKDEMEVDVENDKTKDETGKDKMEVDIENETGATTDEMQLDHENPIQGPKDVDMPDVSQKTPKPTSDDIEMRDGSISSIPNVIGKQNNQNTTAEQPSTPVPNRYRPQQATPRPQASNVSDKTMSDKASFPAPRSRDQRPVIVVRRRPADPMSRRQRALEAKRRWRLAQEQEAASAPDPATEQFRNRPPPMVASQGISARDNRLLLSESTELRKELLHKLQALWPLLPQAEVDRVRLNNLRSKALAEWRKLLSPAGKHTLPENTYISRDAFEREAAEWMKKVAELMTKLKVVPESGPLLETWRETVARREPLPEPGDD
ncbi:hypothetical protein LX32DRAFT_627901 [Colletotrichum zoysiae]|uniref:Uncharacterized protein n=1 Tax=Colletotrichum zoysiae TaxID=1216348 RepID=A0AAD9LZ99_9PEZI|nr:hypothetical protein LX32DRAFT_627901 [Colletotrichum zoysiae]